MAKMSIREMLVETAENVKCNLCGICCPPECRHLENNVCLIHPRQHNVEPNLAACELPPAELVVYFGIFCPPAVEIIERATLVKIPRQQSDPRFCDQESLNRALGMSFGD